MDTPSSNQQDNRKRSSRRIWIIGIVSFLVVTAAILTWYLLAAPFSEKQRAIRSADSKATQLYQEHQKCVATLNETYKKLTSDNQDDYQKAYDNCESIRKQQNEAADQYKRLIQE